MRIRLRTTLAGPALTVGAGEIVTVDRGLARALIEAGYAEPMTEASDTPVIPETPALAVPEVATSGPQRRRGR